MAPKHHVVMFSGGIGSYCAARRVVETHGAQRTTLLFCDTKSEDPDLYRFVDEAAHKLNCRLERIADGRDIWQVFFDSRYLGNTRVDPCSRILKREISDAWLRANHTPESTTCYVGIDWTESHRFEALAPRKLPWVYKAPMCQAPYLTKRQMMHELIGDGIKPPRLYEMGFPHNNCGGFCVKAGQAHFRNLLAKLPERYAYHEAKEQTLRDFLGKDVAILRDRRNGQTRPMTLREMRLRVQAKDALTVEEAHEWGGCGCFGGDPEQAG